MNDRERLQLRAASLHYEHGETMDAVARRLNVSRSTVSRLLKDARSSGLVRIRVVHSTDDHPLVARMADDFDVALRVVETTGAHSPEDLLDRVAAAGADELAALMAGTTALRVGVALGTTIEALVPHLEPQPVGALVVQLNGAANPSTTGIPTAGRVLAAAAEAFGGSMMHFPVPAFFDHASTRDAMWSERSIRRVLDVQDSLDVAVFSVGAMDSPVRSRVYSSDYLDPGDVAELEGIGVVGDVCTVMLRADGSHVGIPLNARASGMAPDRLRQVPHRLCVAAGEAKAAGVLAALRAGVITRLVVDEGLARALDHLLTTTG